MERVLITSFSGIFNSKQDGPKSLYFDFFVPYQNRNRDFDHPMNTYFFSFSYLKYCLIPTRIVMKNKTKFIKANLYALFAVLSILTFYDMVGIEIGKNVSSVIPNAFLMIAPQLGFVWYYWRSYSVKNKKVSV